MKKIKPIKTKTISLSAWIKEQSKMPPKSSIEEIKNIFDEMQSGYELYLKNKNNQVKL